MPNEISSSAIISRFAALEESSRGSKIVIGNDSFVDSFVKMKFAGGMGDIIIGERSYINSCTVLYSGHGILIGNKVLIAANCTLAPVNHGIKLGEYIIDQCHMISKGGIIIEEDVWIGANSVILDGTHIEKGVVVGAGSVVKGRLKSNGIYFGSPIRFHGNRF